MQPDSFKKGDLFEKFVEDELFKATEYTLIHRTNSYDQNASRYAEDTLKPDFKFRCKKTEQEFYVEAKYRSGFNADDKIEVISYTQIERFKVLQKEENTSIYIAIDYGGSPANPESVSLIPLDELSYLDLYHSFLKRYNIAKGLVDSNTLNLPKLQPAALNNKPSAKQHSIKENNLNDASIPFFKNKKLWAVSGIGLVVLGFLLFNAFNTSIEETLKEKTANYYKTISSANIAALENYVNPQVARWYSQTNLTLEEVKENAQEYLKRHPAIQTNIQWDTFTVTPLNDSYIVSYHIIHKLLRENKGKDKIYHLKIHAVWNKDLKITSLYEEKI